jgi:Zn-dependent peptidase ImmA (M78 family)
MKVKPEIVIEWISGAKKPSFKLAKELAKVLGVPFGYLYLDKPPLDRLPVRDFRTLGGGERRVNIHLRELLNDAIVKHEWYKEYARKQGFKRSPFVKRFKLSDNPKQIAIDIKQTIGLKKTHRTNDYCKKAIELVENVGVLVMQSSQVGFNRYCSISVGDCRGFAICDSYAPLVFINSSDAKNAQVFTLFHELAHIWIGESGISDYGDENRVESLCNKVAAEILTPQDEFLEIYRQTGSIQDTANHFCVSRLVIINRARGIRLIGENEYANLVKAEQDRNSSDQPRSKKQSRYKGNPYYTLRSRLGQSFTYAVVISTLEGNTLYRDAGRLLNVSPAVINKLAKTFAIR